MEATEQNEQMADQMEQDLAQVEQEWAAEDLERAQKRAGGVPFEGEVLADWYVGRVLSLDEEEKRLELQHAARLRAIKGRRDGIKARFGAHVENWLRETLDAKKGKAKSIKLASGTVGFRAKPLSADWKQDEDVRKFSESFEPAAECFVMATPPPRPDVKIKLLVEALKEYAKVNDGQLPSGIELVGGCDVMYVSPPK